MKGCGLKMSIQELENAIESEYDNGRTQPLGADGGQLRYIIAKIYNKKYRASITDNYHTKQIRRIWRLDEILENDEKQSIYDFTDDYYKINGLSLKPRI
jgi:hypothetical protein